MSLLRSILSHADGSTSTKLSTCVLTIRTDQLTCRGNNMPWPVIPPNYNLRYGFKDGAQLDLFGSVPEQAKAEKDDSVTGTTGVTSSASYAAESAISSSPALGNGRVSDQDSSQRHMEVPGHDINSDQCPDTHAMEDGSCHPGQSEWEAWNILVSPDGALAYIASPGAGENGAESS